MERYVTVPAWIGHGRWFSYSCQGLNRRLTAHFPPIFRFVTQVASLNRDRRNVHLKYRPDTSHADID